MDEIKNQIKKTIGVYDIKIKLIDKFITIQKKSNATQQLYQSTYQSSNLGQSLRQIFTTTKNLFLYLLRKQSNQNIITITTDGYININHVRNYTLKIDKINYQRIDQVKKKIKVLGNQIDTNNYDAEVLKNKNIQIRYYYQYLEQIRQAFDQQKQDNLKSLKIKLKQYQENQNMQNLQKDQNLQVKEKTNQQEKKQSNQNNQQKIEKENNLKLYNTRYTYIVDNVFNNQNIKISGKERIITKLINDNKWTKFQSKQSLPTNGIYSFQVKVIKTRQKNISLGVEIYNLNQNQMSTEIKYSGIGELSLFYGKQTHKKQGIRQIWQGCTLCMQINMNDKFITWSVNHIYVLATQKFNIQSNSKAMIFFTLQLFHHHDQIRIL